MGKGLLGNIGFDDIFGKDNNNWLVIALVIIVVISLLGRDHDKKKEY